MRSRSVIAAVLTGVACLPSLSQDTGSLADQRARALWQEKVDALQPEGEGCFTIEYPSLEWRRVACVQVPARLFPIPSGLTRGGTLPGAGVGHSLDTCIAREVSNWIAYRPGSLYSPKGLVGDPGSRAPACLYQAAIAG